MRAVPLTIVHEPFLHKEVAEAPKLIRLPRRDELTKNQVKFLQCYCRMPSVGKTAEVLDMDSDNHNRWKRESEAYREAAAAAEVISKEFAEAEAWRRGVLGLRRYKFFNGKPIMHPVTGAPYYEEEYSDNILLAIIRANDPKKYREHSKVESDVNVKGRVLPSDMTKEQERVLDDWEKIPLELRLQVEEALDKAREEGEEALRAIGEEALRATTSCRRQPEEREKQ